MISIHPCRHASTMKMMIEWMKSTPNDTPSNSSSDKTVLRVDQYLLVFLKFISGVIPTIDYDHTMSISKS